MKEKYMACKKCGKREELYYIMNPKCGWCKRADPVVDELIKDGYKVTTLDVQKAEDQKKANTIKEKYNVQCGTPLFIDAKNGNHVCGFREKDILEKWAKGEVIPQPPQKDTQPQIAQVKLDYIWLDGSSSKNLRTKTHYEYINMGTIKNENDFVSKLPVVSFDGSSTNQANVKESDLLLKPVKVVVNPMEIPAGNSKSQRNMSYVVLCEVINPDGTPHATNTRATLRNSLENNKENKMLFGIEQEYVLFDKKTYLPVGWDDYEDNTPKPQGDYYCGVGGNNITLREFSDTHAKICNIMKLGIIGTNSEVMPGQWEYQLQPQSALVAADNLWLSRYILHRISESMKLSVSLDPKPMDGDWNGSAAHINFSTQEMRENPSIEMMNIICSSLEEYHKEAISHYGEGNERRLIGTHETSSIDNFTWGESDRTVSIRIPLKGSKYGYMEDRRPAANMDPYEAINNLLNSVSSIAKEMMITA